MTAAIELSSDGFLQQINEYECIRDLGAGATAEVRRHRKEGGGRSEGRRMRRGREGAGRGGREGVALVSFLVVLLLLLINSINIGILCLVVLMSIFYIS